MTGILSGKTALITGSTAGIGAETARLFAAEGAAVIVSGRDAGRGAAVVDEITQKGGAARFVRLDLQDDESVRAAAAEAGDVDVLVNNAALAGTIAPTIEQDLAVLDASFALNVRAGYLLVQLLAPAMLRKGQGSIVNISTMLASSAMPGRSVYSASKAAVEALTRAWAVEFGPSGVRVNTVAPGPVGTEAVLERLDPELVAKLVAGTILKRIASPAEIAAVVLFAASDQSSYLTGSTIHADAGYTTV
jgi:NAD(P)-dependent dehydrogenase (short-subunit alcohol dehydrogenase family)